MEELFFVFIILIFLILFTYLLKRVRRNSSRITQLENKDDIQKVQILELTKEKDALEASGVNKSQYLARMSHDLKTPLNSILGFTKVLMKNKSGHLDEEELSYLQRIHDNGKALLEMIREILDLAKIEATILKPNLQLIDLKLFISTIISQLEGKLFEKNIVLKVNISDQLLPFETDPRKFRDILVNLIGNAIKYTHKGEINISVKEDPSSHKAIQIDVSDTGIGIGKDQLKKIFEPFYERDHAISENIKGSGLGLSIVKSLCNFLGYEILVKSELNKGSTFSILLLRGNCKTS